ncbi:agamous-like MADS-box protein AGL75 [Humulus lupulus]|uniref:agamous-like MADS-box protein AGL75 n=1 Tax=Humulus lupulus TaxID=3486 RepID=UPI002B40E1FD|nr:agamous-like MADS-box protein AGL75 [Humulus lupulus]
MESKIFQRRRFTLKKKASELSNLCNSEVCLVCYDPNGNVEVWPEDPTKARSIITKYYSKLLDSSSNNKKKRKHSEVSLSHVLEKKMKKLQEQVTNTCSSENIPSSNVNGFSSSPLVWDEKLASLSENSLMGLAKCLEAKIQALDEKIEIVKGKEQLIISETLVQNHQDYEDEFYHTLPPLPPQQYEPLLFEDPCNVIHELFNTENQSQIQDFYDLTDPLMNAVINNNNNRNTQQYYEDDNKHYYQALPPPLQPPQPQYVPLSFEDYSFNACELFNTSTENQCHDDDQFDGQNQDFYTLTDLHLMNATDKYPPQQCYEDEYYQSLPPLPPQQQNVPLSFEDPFNYYFIEDFNTENQIGQFGQVIRDFYDPTPFVNSTPTTTHLTRAP